MPIKNEHTNSSRDMFTTTTSDTVTLTGGSVRLKKKKKKKKKAVFEQSLICRSGSSFGGRGGQDHE
ncbi:hypothetical protein TYRP_018462 [Tyrophagus putrescentiae]|nr:hypothetical protein TYRP_018462 [Tyrophagus putrescentiae]